MSDHWTNPTPPQGPGGDPASGQPSPWDMPSSPPVAPPPHVAPPGAPGGWGTPSPGTATPEDPLRTAAPTPQQLWEQPQSWDPPAAGGQDPSTGAHYGGAAYPAGPYGAAPYAAAPYGVPGQPWGPGRPAPGSVPQPQPLRTAVGMMWIGAAVTVLGSLSIFLFVDDIREEIEAQALADGQVVSESTLDAALTLGIVFGIASGLVTAGLWVWMAVMNGKGRSWARIVATIFAALGIVFGLFGLLGAGLSGTTAATAPDVVRQIITLGLAIGTTVLLWSRQNALYYQANS